MKMPSSAPSRAASRQRTSAPPARARDATEVSINAAVMAVNGVNGLPAVRPVRHPALPSVPGRQPPPRIVRFAGQTDFVPPPVVLGVVDRALVEQEQPPVGYAIVARVDLDLLPLRHRRGAPPAV